MGPCVGVLGLGLVGRALAERLVAASFEVEAFDPDVSKLTPAGVRRAAEAREMTAGTVVVAVYDGAQAEQALLDLNDRTTLCVTTCEPARAERLAARYPGFIEAPVSGTSREIREGSALCLLAGDAVRIESARSVLDALFPRRVYIGAPGSAAKAKLGINLVLQLNRAALAEGLALASRMAVPEDAFLQVLRQSAASSAVMESKGDKMVRRDYSPESRLAQTLKDARLILDEARGAGQTLPLMETNLRLLERAISLCGPDADPSAIIESLRP